MNTMTASMQQVEQVAVGDLRVRLEVLAWTAARHGHDDLAAHLFGAVAAAAEAVGASCPRIDPRDYEQARAAVRSRLGQTPYAVAWDEGYRMSPDQAVRRATSASRSVPGPPLRSLAGTT